MINITCCLWDANDLSASFSCCYDESWVDKLYRGFARNLTMPFRFVVFTERDRHFQEPVISVVKDDIGKNGYGDCICPFELNEPMIFVGLDTVIVGNVNKLARWCLEHPGKMALPRHPYEDYSINGVVLCGSGMRHIYDDWRGENDMKWLRQFEHERIDTLWPGRVVSYKASVARQGLSNKVRIVYFHGIPKPDRLESVEWIKRHWR